MPTRRFDNSDYTIQDEDQTLLVAFDEKAVYGLELALPDADDDPYRVDLVRTTRDSYGAELSQRLTIDEYASHGEAEERYLEASNDLYQNGRDAISDHLPDLNNQTPQHNAGFMVASYPPDAIFTGESTSVSLIGIDERGVQDAMVGWNLPPNEASHLSQTLEDAQAEGGTPLLLETATREARSRGQLESDQPLLPASPDSPTAYLDKREMLEHEAEPAIQESDWGWHDARFETKNEAEDYREALTEYIKEKDELEFLGSPDKTAKTEAFMGKVAETNGLSGVEQPVERDDILKQGVLFYTRYNLAIQPISLHDGQLSFDSIINL